MNKMAFRALMLIFFAFFYGCGHGSAPSALVVNSTEDLVSPPQGTVTLRSALGSAESDQTIRFAPDLDGATLDLTLVGEAHSVLKGEVMGMRDEESGPVSYLVGYFDRDYGASALYCRKNVRIDASALPQGITLRWSGAEDARILAVYGDLTLVNVTLTGGQSVAVDISEFSDRQDYPQPYTLGRGGALAVWGMARLTGCTLYDNHCRGDFGQSRDRGAFGGGLYAENVDLTDCVIGGNTVTGAGAAGGGVYAVGGVQATHPGPSVTGCAISGNRISGLFAYGAGLYSDGGGIGNRKELTLTRSTLARNLAGPAPGLPPFLLAMGYWRGAGVYMSNGDLAMAGCTVAENETRGYARTDDLGKSNLAGGIAATIGNAHAVENMRIGQSIVSGNTVSELNPADGLVVRTYDHDIFTGSLLYFRSRAYNRIGVIDFSQMLVPVGETGWASLCRRHFPKQGDDQNVAVDAVLDLNHGITYSDRIVSAGVNAGQPAVLYYQPEASARDRIPPDAFQMTETLAEYEVAASATDTFPAIMLSRLESHYDLPGFAATFTDAFEAFLQSVDLDPDTPGNQPYTHPDGEPVLTLSDTRWYGPAVTWPKERVNYPYIEFWHRLDETLADQSLDGMGAEILGDDAWTRLFSPGPLDENPGIVLSIAQAARTVSPVSRDQLGTERNPDGLWDIGAIEAP